MTTVEDFQALVGKEVGLSDWMVIDQAMIDKFADATGDHQFIHIDPVRAKQTPFGGTIAHGFLVLSLYPILRERSGMPVLDGVKMGVNYGGNRVRFLTPVPSGAKVRGRFVLSEFASKGEGRWQETIDYSVEIEGAAKPALIAEWITQVFV
jgi:acyl dehydratase